MPTKEQEKKITAVCRTLVGVGDAALAARLTHEIARCTRAESVPVARDLPQLVDLMERASPRVILLDDDLVHGAPLLEFLRQLTESESSCSPLRSVRRKSFA